MVERPQSCLNAEIVVGDSVLRNARAPRDRLRWPQDQKKSRNGSLEMITVSFLS